MKRYQTILSLLIVLCVGSCVATAQPSERLSIEEYRARVLDYSQQIKQSRSQTQAMKEAVKVARSARLPQFNFGASGQYRITDYTLDIGSYQLSMAPTTYSLEAPLMQSVYQGGVLKNTQRAAEIQQQIAQESESLTRNHMLQSAEMSYWMGSARRALYRILDDYVEIIAALERVLTDRFTEGQISKTDLLQVQARKKEAEIQLSEAYKAYQVALQNLNILMGETPNARVATIDSITTAVAPPTLFSLDETIANRPEFTLSNLELDYQNTQIKLSRSRYNPKLNVGIQPTWGTMMLNFDGSTTFQAYGVASLSIPIFGGGARRKSVAREVALYRSRSYDRQMTIDRISKELSNSWTNLTENTKQLKVAWQACEIAQENLDLNTFSYNEGRVPIIDVLAAQASWIQSYSSLIQTALQQKLSLTEYKVAIGYPQ